MLTLETNGRLMVTAQKRGDCLDEVRGHLARCAVGEPPSWEAGSMTVESWLQACESHGVTGVVYQQVQRRRDQLDWPSDLIRELALRARMRTVQEWTCRNEIARVLGSLADQGIVPLLIKERRSPRSTTTVAAATGDTTANPPEGFRRRVASDEISDTRPTAVGGEFRSDRNGERSRGVVHVIDLHWRVSSQSVFARMLTYDELRASSESVPGLGPSARTVSTLHALLLACAHPAMHHRNDDRLIWAMDVHLLATRLSEVSLLSFARLAVEKRVAGVCAHALRRANATFATPVPQAALDCMESARAEPSDAYCDTALPWLREQIMNFRDLDSWGSRLGLLREMMLPGAGYMPHSYALTDAWWVSAVLPALYFHRATRGAWRILAGHGDCPALRRQPNPAPGERHSKNGATMTQQTASRCWTTCCVKSLAASLSCSISPASATLASTPSARNGRCCGGRPAPAHRRGDLRGVRGGALANGEGLARAPPTSSPKRV
jgi:hypothetical protein